MTRERRLSLASPLDGPSCPSAEIVASTRREEARAAMATVSGLREQGVPVRDVAVVARDLDPYEEPLFRAAIGYDVTPVFWTQLRVTRTQPYALVDALCATFADERIGPDALLRPLEHGWAPVEVAEDAVDAVDAENAEDAKDAEDAEDTKDAEDAGEADVSGGSWPVDRPTIESVKRVLPPGTRSIADWHAELADGRVESTTTDVDERVRQFVAWAATNATAEPTPETVGEVMRDALAAYRTVGLPAIRSRDSPALLETEREARAVNRVTTLVAQVERKYGDWLAEGTVTESWDAVRELCHALATGRPGRREHSNARAVDVMEANDVWALSVPYVIVVGLVEGEWPQPPGSVVPPELQETVLAGEGATGVVAPRTAWGDGQDRDHFADAMRAAARGVVVTRHTRTSEGDERAPSPYLAWVDAETVTDPARRRLTSTDGTLPEPIATWVATDAEGPDG